MEDAFLLNYSNYPLSRVITVFQIVSADYIDGTIYDAPHVHKDALELIYCIKGSCTALRDTAAIPMETDDVVLISPGVRHTISARNPDTVLFVVSFCCSCSCLDVLRNARFRVTPSQRSCFQEIIKELKAAFRLNGGELRLFRFRPNSKSPVGAEQLICCYLEQIMIGFLREVTSENGEIIESRYFSRAIRQYVTDQVTDYVRSHLSEKITVSDVANEFHYSRSRLSTIYKKATGLGLNEFITHERISKAKELLEEGTLSITQISDRLGFSTPEYFSRRFAQCTGMTPTRYAAKYRAYGQGEAFESVTDVS